MGKRELLLAVAFVVIGVIVYQVTAPAPTPGTEGASLSAIWRNVQRQMKGNRATATADSTETAPDAGVRELRIAIPRTSTITVAGSDRAGVSAQLHVTGRGFDDTEARAVAAATRLRLDRVGDAIVIRLDMTSQPRTTPLSQVTITVYVPRRLTLRIEPHAGPLTVANVAALTLVGARGDTRVSSIDGAADMTITGGQLTLDGCGALKLTLRGVRATIQHVRAGATIDAVGGRLQFDGVLAETRIDARSTRLDLSLAAAASVTIYSTAEDITITAPAAGYTIDAVATGGRVAIDDATLPASTSADEQRVSGSVRGGGRALVLRATHAGITVRAHAK